MHITTRPIILVLTALLGVGEHPGRDDVRCTYARRAVCEPEACTSIAIASNYLLIPAFADIQAAMAADQALQVRRCDAKGCTPVDVVAIQAGDYLVNLVGPASSFLMRVSVADEPITGLRAGEFAETAYLLRTGYMGSGRCRQ